MAQAGTTPLPTEIPGFGPVRPFASAHAAHVEARPVAAKPRGDAGGAKVLPGLRAAIEAFGLTDGATISFHHHLRNGGGVLNAVLAEVAAMGLKDIRVAASSIFPVHAPLLEHIRIGGRHRRYDELRRGPVAEPISAGALATPAVLQTHGGRARAIACGELRIDAAFVAAPTADACGNVNGVDGRAACGTLGYPVADVRYAGRVVAVTDNLVTFPSCPIRIAQDQVDHVVRVETIGDPRQIASGTTRVTTKPDGLKIAATAAHVVEASALLVDGFSFQTGAGGVSLAVAAALKEATSAKGIVGSFAAGGITGGIVEMFHAGLFRTLLDVQCFDLDAVESYRRDAAHQSMSASMYANPHNRGVVVNQLDAMILGAAEVDLDFNVNVTLGASGPIIGGSGGTATPRRALSSPWSPRSSPPGRTPRSSTASPASRPRGDGRRGRHGGGHRGEPAAPRPPRPPAVRGHVAGLHRRAQGQGGAARWRWQRSERAARGVGADRRRGGVPRRHDHRRHRRLGRARGRCTATQDRCLRQVREIADSRGRGT
jgi:citrate lyase subunit alpha / citrate CoA-transferase